MILTFEAFLALCALMMPTSYVNFKHQVKSHQTQVEPRIVLLEDSALKAKGIRLPGYNH